MSKKIVITKDMDAIRSKAAPLYCRYNCQMQPQPAYIEINLDTGAASCDYNGVIGNAVPLDVWHGVALRFYVPPAIKGRALADLMQSEGLVALANELLMNAEIKQDNNYNWVGRLTEKGKQLENEISAYIDASINPETDTAPIWDADYLANSTLAEIWNPEHTLDQAISEIEQAAESEGAQIDVDLEELLLTKAGDVADSNSEGVTLLSELQMQALLENGYELDEDQQASWDAKNKPKPGFGL